METIDHCDVSMITNKTPLTPRGYTCGRLETLWRETGRPSFSN